MAELISLTKNKDNFRKEKNFSLFILLGGGRWAKNLDEQMHFGSFINTLYLFICSCFQNMFTSLISDFSQNIYMGQVGQMLVSFDQ